jgi:hypothetical protein
MDELIKVLKTVNIQSTTPIPIELVRELDRIRKSINHIDEPIFVDASNKQVKNYWDDFKFTGLNNIDYITSDYYLVFENDDELPIT